MKKILLFGLIALLGLFNACQDDDGELSNVLRYDEDNLSAPLLDIGTHEAAAKFTSSQTNVYTGKNLEEVEFYINELPAACEVLVYEGGGGNAPGALLYSANITTLQARAWHRHVLSNPITITGGDIWVAVRVQHNSRIGSIGCDPGPAVNNGDWIRVSGNTQWETFRQATAPTTVDINWNIRARVGGK